MWRYGRLNEEKFTDFLNFFEFIGVLHDSEHLTFKQVYEVFDYYLKKIKSDEDCQDWIEKYSFEKLKASFSEDIIMAEYLFVYGTLRKNYDLKLKDRVRHQLQYVGKAKVGAVLYDLGRYPGAIKKQQRDRRSSAMCFC